MRSPRVATITMGVAAAALIGSATYLYASHESVRVDPAPIYTPGPRRSDAQVRDLDIAFYEKRIVRDPTSALDLAKLGHLYLTRSRETGNYDDVLRAERVARASLGDRTSHNGTAAQVLASALLSEHRFAEALDIAHGLAALDPSRVSYRAMCAEIAMELGRYAEAGATFDSLRTNSASLSVAPRLARWDEIQGHPDAARVLMRHAIAAAALRPDLPAEQRAWFWLRLGDLELRSGHPDTAAQAYRTGLAIHPNDYRLLAAEAHASAVQHDWRAAIASGEAALESASLDPVTFGTISDSYLALGDTARAGEYAHAMEVAVSKQPGSYHRAWSLFLLDHSRRVPEVLRKARGELRTRQDIYGYDVLAWALYKSGRYRDAHVAITRALSQGTQDAMLYYHAGMIARASGDVATARTDLTRALEVNPYFHPTEPDEARAVLAELGR